MLYVYSDLSVYRRHKSVQGESDSEEELIDTLSSGLESMMSTDSSDNDMSEDEDDLFDSPEKHVFLTAKGPVHLTSGCYICRCCVCVV